MIKLEKLFKLLEMPASFKDLGINNPNITLLTNIVTSNGTKIIEHPKKNMDKEVVETIFKSCI